MMYLILLWNSWNTILQFEAIPILQSMDIIMI